MYEQLDSVFAEHAAPSHCGTREVHNRIGPIAELLADVQQQLARYRRLILAAELAPHDHAIDPKLHSLHLSLDGLDAVTSEVVGRWRVLARSLVVFDETMAEAKASLGLYAINNPATDATTTASSDAGADVR